MHVARFRSSLLAWYHAHRRDLPWRRTSDPYAVWVSEIMLQQTQVSRVVAYWPRFLDRFPTVRSLADAPEDEVLALWSGLGYYRRARQLRAAAAMIVDRFGGRVPASLDDLRSLPGMGDYTAAAVASIAFAIPVPVVDANVTRLLSRLLALRGNPARANLKRRLREEAARLLDPRRPGAHNQAMMELGGAVCASNGPRCTVCPVAGHCRALRRGRPERYPATLPAAPTLRLRESVAVVRRRGMVLLARRTHERGWWAGLWTLPRCPLRDAENPPGRLPRLLQQTFGLSCALSPLGPALAYGVTRHRVAMLPFGCDAPRGRLRAASEARWVPMNRIDSLALPAPHRKLLDRSIERP